MFPFLASILAENLNTKLGFGLLQAILGMIGLFKKAEIRLSEIWQRMRPTRPNHVSFFKNAGGAKRRVNLEH
jgi:hypothetical protein